MIRCMTPCGKECIPVPRLPSLMRCYYNKLGLRADEGGKKRAPLFSYLVETGHSWSLSVLNPEIVVLLRPMCTVSLLL